MSTQELLKTEYGKASIMFPSSRLVLQIDRSQFKKSMDEKGKLYTLKKSTPKKKLALIGRYEF